MMPNEPWPVVVKQVGCQPAIPLLPFVHVHVESAVGGLGEGIIAYIPIFSRRSYLSLSDILAVD